MKLQLEAEVIRIRIGEAELACLQSDGSLDRDYALDTDAALRLRIRLVSTAAEACLRWASASDPSGTTCTLRLDRAELASYVATLPCKQGLCWTLARPGRPDTTLTFEVDVRDSIGRRGPRNRG